MRSKLVLSILIAMMVVLSLPGVALADHGDPVGGCPVGFHLHHVGGDEHGDHMHQHIGIQTDLNGDGYYCVKHVGNQDQYHVHIDNYIPLD